MKISRPSPAMVVSIVALVIACAGTATAAGVLIKNSSQVKAGAINGSDIKNKSVNGVDIADATIGDRQLKKGLIGTDQLAPSVKNSLTNQGFTANEATRKIGPTKTPAGQHDVATMAQLAPGTYAIFAKTTITAEVGNLGLGELLRQNKTVSAQCALTAGGDQDNASGLVASPYSQAPNTLNMQITRTIDVATDVKVSCTINDYVWNASDTSIVALKLSGSSRTDVQG